MRQLLTLTLSLYAAFGSLKAQDSLINREIKFENNDYLDLIEIDSNSIWQIGDLNPKWNNGNSNPGITTDTLQFYPTNDSSYFILKFPTIQRDTSIFKYSYSLDLTFFYNIDAGKGDFGRIYYSIDNGLFWENPTLLPNSYINEIDTFEGTSNNWNPAGYNLTDLYDMGLNKGDTILIAFLFSSDSVDENKKGWAIDNIQIKDFATIITGLEKFSSNFSFIDHLGYIHVSLESYDHLRVNVINWNGQIINTQDFYENGEFEILNSNGLYLIQYIYRNSESPEKEIKYSNKVYINN